MLRKMRGQLLRYRLNPLDHAAREISRPEIRFHLLADLLPTGSADFDVYASPLGEDGYVGPGVLVHELSSAGRDTRIFLRKDGLEAFVTSNRTGGQGLIDIWVSTRGTLSDLWSVPIDLGSPVNSEFDDGSPWLSKDGTTLYFFSDRPGSLAEPGSLAKRDIWYTTRVQMDEK